MDDEGGGLIHPFRPAAPSGREIVVKPITEVENSPLPFPFGIIGALVQK